MGNRFVDFEGNVWEVVQDDGRYITLRNMETHESQEVSLSELRECFEEDDWMQDEEELW